MRLSPLFHSTVLLLFVTTAQAEVKATFEQVPLSSPLQGPAALKTVPKPSRLDAATKATFSLIDGERDRNGGDLPKLQDGRLPREDDQPSENFFLRSDGGRITLDLGAVIPIQQVNSYSRHTDVRAPQVYKLYGSDGTAANFNAAPKNGTDPTTCGWKLISSVDTRPKEKANYGGFHAVSVADSLGTIGKYRHLLLDIARTETDDSFGNTFYSEIDVIDANAPKLTETEAPLPEPKVLKTQDGKYQFVLDTSLAPDLTEWSEKALGPVVLEWYPKIVKMLPSDGFEPPTRITLGFREDMGGTPASAGGTRVNLNVQWFRGNQKGEGIGAVVHELVHIVQQYGRARRTGTARPPGWIVEGIPDYIRWFLYEPQTHGADLTPRNITQARYDSSYRITGNFINWVTENYDPDIVRKLNVASREGRYTDDLWKEYTGKTVQELADAWKKSNEERLAARAASKTASTPGAPQ